MQAGDVSRLIALTLVSALVGQGCTTRLEIREKGALSTIKMKGDYRSAAYCFSREWRKNTGTGYYPEPVVEIDPGQDFAEIYFVPAFPIDLVFRGTDDGNSLAEIYGATTLNEKFLEYTKSCQLEPK